MSTISVVITSKTELSFSGVIDQALAQSGELTSIDNYEGYLNSIIREAQSHTKDPRDLVESEIAVTDNPMTVNIPPFFRDMQAVRYTPGDIEPMFMLPGPKQKLLPYPYYISGTKIVFGNVTIGGTVKLSYYVWAPPYSYYPRPDSLSELKNNNLVPGDSKPRPAFYDAAAGLWMYLQADATTYASSLPTEAEMEAARRLSGNWLITDWFAALKAGLISSLFTSKGDTQKSAPYYSQYRTWLTTLENSGIKARQG